MRHRLVLLAVMLTFSAGAASADSITVFKGDASWHPFETPSTAGAAFWNNPSFDSNGECNVGYWLSATGGCVGRTGPFTVTGPGLTPDFLGDASTGFSLTKDSHQREVVVTNLMELTEYRAFNEFGWFDVTDPSTLNALFTSLGTVGARATFAPSDSYGFYLTSPEGTYLSTGVGDNRTHFALFELSAGYHYILGSEDMWVGSDWDFNDVILEVQMIENPEPASLVLLGSGLAGLGAAVRRRRRR